MYKVEWDKETGGVILNNRITDQTLGIAPRPVFFEELDLLGWISWAGFTRIAKSH
jgi:phosphoadenosine phosphosulfate reductase